MFLPTKFFRSCKKEKSTILFIFKFDLLKEYEFDKHSEKQNFFKEEIKKLNSQLHDQEQYIKELLKEIDQLKYAKTINKVS